MNAAARILLVAAAYFATGRLGLLLAISPGYATAVWPPSGIALAALLVAGNRAWPGVLIGSFLVNLTTTHDGGRFVVAALAIAAGATIQALLGASLIRRAAGTPLELLRPRHIAAFFLLGGPLSCVAAATVGVGALYATGVVQAAQIPFSWWTWWVGDVIGVAVAAPLVLIAFGEPRDLWRRRALPVALPLATLLALVTALFVVVKSWEVARISSQFQERAVALGAALKGRLEESGDVLRSLESYHAASSVFDRASFRRFVERPLSRDPSLQALSWNPRVPDADRAAFEQGGADGPCPIKDRDDKERLIPAPKRSEYVPIRYIEPHDANAAALGFDVSSGIVRNEALRRAGDSGLPSATRKLRLVQEDSASGLLIFLPVYSRSVETVEDRRRHLAGYFATALRLEQFLAPVARRSAEAGIDVDLQDGGVEPFWQSSPSAAPAKTPAEFQHAIPFEFGGRSWTALCRATPGYVSGVRSWTPWGILAGGMVAAALVGAVLLGISGRR